MYMYVYKIVVCISIGTFILMDILQLLRRDLFIFMMELALSFIVLTKWSPLINCHFFPIIFFLFLLYASINNKKTRQYLLMLYKCSIHT